MLGIPSLNFPEQTVSKHAKKNKWRMKPFWPEDVRCYFAHTFEGSWYNSLVVFTAKRREVVSNGSDDGGKNSELRAQAQSEEHREE